MWCLRVSKNGNLGEKLPKVSSLPAKYSHFRETLRGDFFDIDCDVEVAVVSRLSVPFSIVGQHTQILFENALPLSAENGHLLLSPEMSAFN